MKVCESALFRPFMIFALPTLGMLNDQVIETEETKRSAELFDPVQKVLNGHSTAQVDTQRA